MLVQARTQAGTFDVIEMAPTVHCTPENYGPARAAALRPAGPGRAAEAIRHDVVHSEEGGRFHHAENRYMVVEVGDDFPIEVPPDFIWMTARQATSLVRYGNYFNVEARSLLTCLHTCGDRRGPRRRPRLRGHRLAQDAAGVPGEPGRPARRRGQPHG